MAIRIAEYAFIAARQNTIWDNGRCILNMPHYCIIYIKSTSSTPEKTRITFSFPNGKKVDYDADNVILKKYTKEEIIEKQLYPYIPYYILRYEKELKYGTGNIDNAVNDLKYFKSSLREAVNKELLSSYDEFNLCAYSNTVIKHITNGNDYEEGLVNAMGGTLIVTEADLIYQKANERAIKIIVDSLRENGIPDEKIKAVLISKYNLTRMQAESYL